jgi:hypothetical protein
LRHVEFAEQGGDETRAKEHEQEDGTCSVDTLSLPTAVSVGRSAGFEGIGDADDDALGAGRNELRFSV